MKTILQNFLKLFIILGMINIGLFSLLSNNASASSPRKILVENYSSSLLPSGQSSNSAFRNIYLSDSDIIPLYFSVNLNEGDEINNLEELTGQRYGQFYPMDIPMSNAKFCVNGEQVYLPQLQSTINKFKNKTSPFTMYVIETITPAKILGTVVIETDVDIPPSAQLFFAAVEKSVNMTSGSNETFYNVARLFQGSPLIGINITMKAGERRGFNEVFTYNSKWKKDQMYLCAFIQDFAKNKEVLQSATTYDNSKAKPTIATNMSDINYTNDNFSEIIELELINSSLANVDISSISFEGPGKDAFKVQWDLNQPTLYAANRKIVSFQFNPLEEGTFEANLVVNSNATNKPVLTIPVKGVLDGIVPLPTIEFNASILEFGQTGTYKEQDLAVVNNGNVNLVIDSIYVPSPDDKIFKVIGEAPKVIAAGKTANVKIRFTPAKSETYFTEIIFKSNATNDPEATIGLSGEGITVKPYSTLKLNADTINFGTVSSIIYTNLIILNDGNKDLTISNFSLQNNQEGAFKVEEGAKTVIKPNEQINVSISFDPKENKTYEATLLIKSDAQNDGLKLIGLVGTGEGIIIGSIDNELSEKIKLYPNPTINNLQLELPLEIRPNNIELINIMDITGNLIQTLEKSELEITNQTLQFRLKNLSAGVYLLKIKSENDEYVAKFVIQL